MGITEVQITKQVEHHLRRLFIKNSVLQELVENLNKNGEVFLLGGAVRDIITNTSPRDYDFVVDLKKEPLEEIVSNFNHRKNSFGGYKIFIEDMMVDVWSLENTWAFKKGLIPASPQNLPYTVFFNINSVAVDLTNKKTYIGKFAEALDSKVLDIVLEKNPLPELCVLRAFVFQEFKDIKFSSKLEEFITRWKVAAKNPLEKLSIAQRKHYGREMLSSEQIKNYLERY